jgi:group I intron endonuclease
MIIYLLSFPNGKHYVGRTRNSLEQRLTEHKTRATKGYQHPLYYAINKYGWDNITKRTLHNADTEEELVLKELEFIKQYNSLQSGYNLTLNTEIGGDNWKGRRDTEEYVEFVEKMKELNSSNRMHGKRHSTVTIQLQREKAKGRFSLPWFIERYGESEGTEKYQERNFKLKNRNYNKMKDPVTGVFKKKTGNKKQDT